jgi:nucleoside-diphosphate-sugar epimerase
MKVIATGLSGTIGKKVDKDIEPAQVVLGSEKLSDYFISNHTPVTLIHLGGIVGEAKVSEDLTYSKLINVDETFKLACEVIENFGGRFIHISSSHVYGPAQSALSEISPYNPQSNYATQKMLAEQLLLNHFGENHEKLLILRVFSVLGWDVSGFTLGGAVNRILSGSSELVTNSDDVRDFMTPTSIAKSISVIAKDSQISGIFNLCVGQGITVGEAVRSMFKVKNFQEHPNQIQRGTSSAPQIIGDNTKLMKTGIDLDLKWDPSNDLK